MSKINEDKKKKKKFVFRYLKKSKVFAFVATVAISTMIMSEVLLIMHFKNEHD